MYCNICMTGCHDTCDCSHRDTVVNEQKPHDDEEQRWLEKESAKKGVQSKEAQPHDSPALSRETRQRLRKEFIIEQQDRLAQQRHNLPFYQLSSKKQEDIREQVEKDNPDEEQAEAERQRLARAKKLDRQDLQANFLFKKFWHQCSDQEQEAVRRSIERCEKAKEERC